VGTCVVGEIGDFDGDLVGELDVGIFEGKFVAIVIDGDLVGGIIGELVGFTIGELVVGTSDGDLVGGLVDGDFVGLLVDCGVFVGCRIGLLVDGF